MRKSSEEEEEQPPPLISRNGDFDQRVQRMRDSQKPSAPIERAERQMHIVPVSQQYTKDRKEFKNKNLEKIKLSQSIIKEGLKPKQFYPYVIRQPEKVSLKDNKPNIEMKRGRININEVVISRNGEQSFPISQFFNTYSFVECSVQFVENHYVQPQFDFFVFDSRKSHSKELKGIFSEASEELMGNEANEVRKLFKKMYNQMSFFDTLHVVVGDILPDWATAGGDEHRRINHDSNLQRLLFPEQVDMAIQCNDGVEEWRLEPPHLYFTNVKVLNNYKRQQHIEIKRLNIYSKEAEVFSDIRYILHPEKTYFIQIMEEVKQAIDTALDVINDQSFNIEILQQVYELLYAKAQEFLLLICTYIPSSIDLQIRTKKLSEYFWSNFMYMQEIHQASPQMLQKYNVLASWYSMPQRMFGYRRQEIQNNFYSLVRNGCQIQRTLNFKRKLQDLTHSNLEKIQNRVDKQRTTKKKKTTK